MQDVHKTDHSNNELAVSSLTQNAGQRPSNVKVSRAARRREKKAEQRRAQDEALSKAAASSLNSQRSKEMRELEQQLQKRNLRIHEVPSDGDCLYLSVAHQLCLRGISVQNLLPLLDQSCPSKNDGVLTLSFLLRQLTSQYLLANMNEFLPFMVNPETEQPMTDADYAAYCEAVRKPSTWGGQIEIKALAHALQIPIEVLQSDCPSVVVGEEFSYAQPMTIIYHRHAFALGEHYNSCAPC